MFRKITGWIPVAVAVLVLAGLIGLLVPVQAQETPDGGGRTIAEQVQKTDVSDVRKDFEKRFIPSGKVQGPFNIVVSPTDKGANGVKYTNVPYFQMLGSVMIGFPVGKPDRGGNQEYIYSVNYTITALRRVRSNERSK